jgi:hypothetical protein
MKIMIKIYLNFIFFVFLRNNLKVKLCVIFLLFSSHGLFKDIKLKSQSEKHQDTFLLHMKVKQSLLFEYIVL